MNSHAINVVILAAGKGTRMFSDLPKVLHPLAGKPMLSHVLDTARQLKPAKLCVVYGFGGDLVPATVNDEVIVWAMQAEQKGTGHAVMQAMPLLQDEATTLILFGDVPLIEADTCRLLLEQAIGGNLALLTVQMPDPTGYGRIVRNGNGDVVSIVEHKDASPEQRAIREINTGIMAVPTTSLRAWLQGLKNHNAQGEYYLTDIVAMAVEAGIKVSAVQGLSIPEVSGVNSKRDLAQLERIYQQAQAEKLLQQGVTLSDPTRLDIRGQLSCGRDVSIDVNCVFEGQVSLADGVSVGAHCVIKDSQIGRGAIIAAFTHMEGANVGEGSRIGPYARLRPGSSLAEHTHIGNFVEIKNSEIGQDSKVNHLSYVGDSTVGRNVNIGAGTITCNYDGANKFRTVIGDNAFIGSDSQLVAPVTVGANATIGAGSTITKDAPAGELTLSRGKQITVSGWKRPTKKKS